MNNKLDDTFVIMGIDPGTNIMGFGIIKVEKKEMRLIDMIEYKLPKSDDHNIKLSKTFKKTTIYFILPIFRNEKRMYEFDL